VKREIHDLRGGLRQPVTEKSVFLSKRPVKSPGEVDLPAGVAGGWWSGWFCSRWGGTPGGSEWGCRGQSVRLEKAIVLALWWEGGGREKRGENQALGRWNGKKGGRNLLVAHGAALEGTGEPCRGGVPQKGEKRKTEQGSWRTGHMKRMSRGVGPEAGERKLGKTRWFWKDQKPLTGSCLEKVPREKKGKCLAGTPGRGKGQERDTWTQ